MSKFVAKEAEFLKHSMKTYWYAGMLIIAFALKLRADLWPHPITSVNTSGPIVFAVQTVSFIKKAEVTSWQPRRWLASAQWKHTKTRGTIRATVPKIH